MKDIVNWGVIGCARIADGAGIPAIKTSNNGRLFAIAGRNPARVEDFARRHRPVKTYTDYQQMLADPEVDAVYIALPNSLHMQWAIAALKSGKHVLCEKPLGLNAEQVEEMESVAKENGVLLMEAFAFRHNPAIIRIKQLMDEGRIGKIHLIDADFSFTTDLNDIRMDKKLGGGALYDVGSYTVNLMRYLTGRQPEEIQAFADFDPRTGVDVNDLVSLRYGDGLLATFHCAINCDYTSGFHVIGEKGRIDYPGLYNGHGTERIYIYQQDESDVTMASQEVIPVACDNSYKREVEQLGRCILQGEQPLMSLKETAENLRTLERIFKIIGY